MEIIIIAVAAVLLITILALIFAFRGKISAITMRIIQFEGTVSLEEDGKPKTIRNNTRLNGEDEVSTEASSNVKIGLDDYKIVSLEELSRARISKNGRMLELNLESGTLNFEVSKPLDAEETMDIKTSTMIVGIRGTAGTVSSIDGVDSVEITEGVVHVKATNPYTGEVKETDVHAGEKIFVQVYADRAKDSIEFLMENDSAMQSEEPAPTDNIGEDTEPNEENNNNDTEEDDFELVEVSDEIRNSVLSDCIVQVGNAILKTDGTMTIGEVLRQLETDGPVKYEKDRDTGLYNVYRKVSDNQSEETDKLNELCMIDYIRNKDQDVLDLTVINIFAPDTKSPYGLNFFWAGNIPNNAVYFNNKETLYSVASHYESQHEQRKNEYSQYEDLDYEEYLNICAQIFENAGLEYNEDPNDANELFTSIKLGQIMVDGQPKRLIKRYGFKYFAEFRTFVVSGLGTRYEDM